MRSNVTLKQPASFKSLRAGSSSFAAPAPALKQSKAVVVQGREQVQGELPLGRADAFRVSAVHFREQRRRPARRASPAAWAGDLRADDSLLDAAAAGFVDLRRAPSNVSPLVLHGPGVEANLKILRDRIGSVKNTKKITDAMKLVAAAKVRRAQAAVLGARPFSENLVKVLFAVNTRLAGEDVDVPLTTVRPVKTVRAEWPKLVSVLLGCGPGRRQASAVMTISSHPMTKSRTHFRPSSPSCPATAVSAVATTTL